MMRWQPSGGRWINFKLVGAPLRRRRSTAATKLGIAMNES
jgi:hypothetical protein